MKFRFLEHTADIKFQAFGKSLEEVFENSAYALINVMTKEKIKEKNKKNIKVSGKDLENLLYNFLEEFLFLLDSKNFVLAKISKIKIKKMERAYMLEAEISGDNAENYEFNLDVKAITYNEMFVKRENINGKDKFITQVVVDV